MRRGLDMTFIIDMVTGKRIATDQPCNKQHPATAMDCPAANEILIAPALQPVCSQDIVPTTTVDIASLDIAELVSKFDK